ncbi:lipid II:glycine glycyltransferase FemX [Treponema phagedenis]|uniref:lipid II:glycine glycyltransferase FemX n=1 Tax=Treponema phagedenis TaxID=162 RepID=UPI0001F639C0|nr:peptidoglycan bridge formation glycyltransferase FemA/FemB family protein [Treponema phagedenis]EFW37044.1 FemAB family protein [Treponema phagedenis F0421]TYT78666.1 peptidoglycan bridge formation glycyltransferase FemA/FemB family protein [Treponema phagedenis]
MKEAIINSNTGEGLTVKEIQEKTDLYEPMSFLQSRFWADFKSEYGWAYKQFSVTADSSKFILTVLLRNIRPFGKLAYFPMAPETLLSEDSCDYETAKKQGDLLVRLTEALRAKLPKDVFLFRFDPPWSTRIDNAKGTLENTEPTNVSGAKIPARAKNIAQAFPLLPQSSGGYRIIDAPYDVQPPDTVCLDLSQTEEFLSENLKSKWRYNIRLAEKKGILIERKEGEEAAAAGIDIFYALYQQTAERDAIAIHRKEYYAKLCRKSCPEARIFIYIAEYEKKPLASIITIFTKKEAVYLYGASSNENRNLMPTYLLQWRAILDAKEHGCLRYDFYGIPPTDDPSHPMYGLYRFKTGFGGSILHRVGSLDVPVKPLRYVCYTAAEKLRAFWFKKIKKMLRRGGGS